VIGGGCDRRRLFQGEDELGGKNVARANRKKCDPKDKANISSLTGENLFEEKWKGGRERLLPSKGSK